MHFDIPRVRKSELKCLFWLLFFTCRQGEYIENQNFTKRADEQSVARLFLVVSRSDNHVQYSCEASNGEHFPAVSQKTNFSVEIISKNSDHVEWEAAAANCDN